MSLYDKHPLPWRAEEMPEHIGLGAWWVVDARNLGDGLSYQCTAVIAEHLSEPVAKLLAGAPGVVDAAESVLLDADRSDEAPEVSMVSTVSLQRLREALEQVEERDAP